MSLRGWMERAQILIDKARRAPEKFVVHLDETDAATLRHKFEVFKRMSKDAPDYEAKREALRTQYLVFAGHWDSGMRNHPIHGEQRSDVDLLLRDLAILFGE